MEGPGRVQDTGGGRGCPEAEPQPSQRPDFVLGVGESNCQPLAPGHRHSRSTRRVPARGGPELKRVLGCGQISVCPSRASWRSLAARAGRGAQSLTAGRGGGVSHSCPWQSPLLASCRPVPLRPPHSPCPPKPFLHRGPLGVGRPQPPGGRPPRPDFVGRPPAGLPVRPPHPTPTPATGLPSRCGRRRPHARDGVIKNDI